MMHLCACDAWPEVTEMMQSVALTKHYMHLSYRVKTSWVVCSACVLLLVADLSLLSLVLPLFTFGFTLVSEHTPRTYWQVSGTR